MKKFFITLFISMLAIVADAQMITFAKFTPGNNPLVFNTERMFMYVSDAKNKMQADESIRTFYDGTKFSTRLKTSGTGNHGNQIFLSIKGTGTLTVYASSASNDEARSISIIKGAHVVASQIVEGTNKSPITCKIEKPGEYQVLYPDGPINIYGVKFIQAEETK